MNMYANPQRRREPASRVCVCIAQKLTAGLQDTDKGGNITVEEFARVMRKTNPSVSDEEVSKIISEVDLDGDGTINFDGWW